MIFNKHESSDLQHLFHIPVMGTAFTIDTPIKTARFGISSVISIGDDELCETMSQVYAKQYNIEFYDIDKNQDDFRAKRITRYLNLVKQIIDQQVLEMKRQGFADKDNDTHKYFQMLPTHSHVRQLYSDMLAMEDSDQKVDVQAKLLELLVPGSIDVNIMTKLDRTNYDKNGQELPMEFSDALSAFRGFAKSNLSSSIVFSAGFNRRLYSYIDKFNDFFPDKNGFIKKKIILKVSDYRSSLTQGKFLAKKGLWVSEYRVESGLNCGGHAFATDGYLLGPILEEFKEKRHSLLESLYGICNQSLESNSKITFQKVPATLFTVQGGIGTAKEQNFLASYYEMDSMGWATPFLLVPEVTQLDDETRELLKNAGKDDLYTSGISPLGVPFNSVKGTASEIQKLQRFEDGRPGSPCPKGFLVSNTEFSKKPVCTASTFFQKRKIKQLKELNLSFDALKNSIQQVIDKVCLCEDLASSSLINAKVDNKRPLKTAVCPGPNLAYFSKVVSLKDMVDHIYGRVNLLNTTKRSNMFVNELRMYIKHFVKEINQVSNQPSDRGLKTIRLFSENLKTGMQYYKKMIPKLIEETTSYRLQMSHELQQIKEEFDSILKKYPLIFDYSLGVAVPA
ncbi:hypothetical protein DID75_03335 [Candidatus Marinamargulisbacteria bacterium SCGC AG-410-N11]|nr:hypothetical protein DID75_03335 [Candidatus Marinamargulisbacteria bacterium SCGC AG-410-N11]